MKKLSTISYQLSAGFTLIELLVVISILAILSTLLVSNFAAVRSRARDSQRKSDLSQIRNSLQMYYNDNAEYPLTGSGILNWGSKFASDDGSMVYMNSLPHDPLHVVDEDPDYEYSSDGKTYCLVAALENLSDKEIENSQNRCLDCTVGDNGYVVCPD